MLTISNVVGCLGSAAVILAYFSDQQRWIDSRGMPYLLANLAGSLLIVLSLLQDWNLPAMLIEVFWALISVFGMLRRLSRPDGR